ncbi:MAG: MFS transporter [Gammaproteobacteria bacterium]|nr:MFS transporter [Gammaproteobacteria bacterium]
MTAVAACSAASLAVPTRRAALWALGLLTAMNLLNYLDRFVVAPLASSLKQAMALTDTQLGLLPSVFLVVYMFAAPLFGSWGDRGRRTRPIALGVGLWSVATLLSGLARNYPQLLVARALVGVGEAALVAVAPALLADCFQPAARGRVFAVFNMAIPVGSALGFVLGGAIGAHFGWRTAFLVAGGPGLLLALAALRLPDPPRGAQEEPRGAAAASTRGSGPLGEYSQLLRRTPYMAIVLGYAAYTFALGGLAFWMPSFLERVRGLTQSQAGTQFGEIVVLTGFIGTFAGGWLADYVLRFSRHGYLWVSGAVTVLAAPLALVALAAPQREVYFPALVLAQLLLFMSTGPVNAALVSSVSPLQRASASALCMFTIHLLGDVPSPTLIGYLSHRGSLAHAVLLVPLAILIGGVIWLAAVRVHERAALN